MASAITAEHLQCSHCGEVLPKDMFHRDKTTRGYDPRCRPCRAAYARKKYHEDIVASRARGREHQRRHRFRTAYGLTLDEWQQFVDDQDGACAICKTAPDNPRELCVDHDHNTGQVRQLLCNNCNAGIGMFADDPERLIEAVLYLQRHGVAVPPTGSVPENKE